MHKIITFSEKEKEIIEALNEHLKKGEKQEEIERIDNNRWALYDLAEAISKYPSILRDQHLVGNSRSVETLIQNMKIKNMKDGIFDIPTKAILGQSFSVAKTNFFFLILYIIRANNILINFETTILEIISNNIFTQMVEEVFIGLISDEAIPTHIKNNAGFLLANIWEYRIDYGVKEFAPILNNIWKVKKDFTPAYGTMLGISELFRITAKSGNVWLDFLSREEISQDEIDSMYEFLMGLSYEESKQVENQMQKMKKKIINKDEIQEILGKATIYPEYIEGDPRELFKSFIHRKNNALFRNRSNSPGPKRTIEEYLMCYLLSLPQQWIN